MLRNGAYDIIHVRPSTRVFNVHTAVEYRLYTMSSIDDTTLRQMIRYGEASESTVRDLS